jgi:hypothetical protein
VNECVRERERVCVCVCVCVSVCACVCLSATLPASWRRGLSQVSADCPLLWPLPAQNRPSALRAACPVLPAGGPTVDTRPTRGSRSSADAVGDAASGPVGGPSGAAAAATACTHRAQTRTPQLLQRVGVCARACACRRCCRSRRWPAGKPRLPATRTSAVKSCMKLCEVLGVRRTHGYVRVSPALCRSGASRG